MGGSRGGPPPSLHEMPIPFYIHWDRNIIVTLVLSLYRKIVGTTVSVLNKCRRTNKGVMLRERLRVVRTIRAMVLDQCVMLNS